MYDTKYSWNKYINRFILFYFFPYKKSNNGREKGKTLRLCLILGKYQGKKKNVKEYSFFMFGFTIILKKIYI